MRLAGRSFVTALLASGVAHAEPETTAWVKDVAVQAEHSTQTVLSFEHQLSDVKAGGAGIDLLAARVEAGLTPSVSGAPQVVFRQRGNEALRLQEVALQARWHLPILSSYPQLMIYGSYANDLSDDRDHLLRAGFAASYDYGHLYLNADVRPTMNIGGDHGRALEAWSGLAVGYGWASSWQGRAGMEMFAVIPVIGARLSDPTFGEAAESNTYYYGPSFALAFGPMWTSASAVTGYFVSTAASQFLLSWQVGVAY